MVVAYGAGSAVDNPPITAGPYGREVWNNDLTGRVEGGSKFKGTRDGKPTM